MDTKTCSACAFFVKDNTWQPDIGEGRCHRYPPALVGFPRTYKQSWCGEFKEKSA